MGTLIQTLAFILPIIATLFILAVISLNLYLRIRRKLPIKVNCWFCNEWTRVPYENCNNFDCPRCLQYNGFDQDGGYNRILPEQHDELLNQQVPLMQRNVEFKSNNGLCHICNNNQKLKIYQLANFVPLNEDNFDVEVEHFEKQLEKAYKLCSKCEQTVKRIIITQNKWLMGLKISNLKSKGLSLLDLTKPSGTLSKKTKQTYFLYFIKLTLIFSATVIFFYAFCNIDISKETVNSKVPHYIVPYAFPILDFLNKTQFKLKDIFKEQIHLINATVFNSNGIFLNNSIVNLHNISNFAKYTEKIPFFQKPLNLNRPDINQLCYIGLFLQVISIYFNKDGAYRNVKQMLLWCCLLIQEWYQYIEGLDAIIYILQVITSASILYTFFTRPKTRKDLKVHKKKKHRKVFLEDSANEDEFESDIAESRFNSTLLKSSFQTANETDTADSDCSYESIKLQLLTNGPNRCMISPIPTYKTEHIFGKPPIFTNSLNPSPISFKEFNTRNSVFNESFKNDNVSNFSFKSCNSPNSTIFNQKNHGIPPYDNDLNESLDNLHLSGTNFETNILKKVPIVVLKNNFRRPIISPPKFVRVNSWDSQNGSFLRSYDMTSYVKPNFSRSSSQSSGFASQNNEIYNLKYPFWMKNNFSDDDCNSILSEPSHVQKFSNYRQNSVGGSQPSIWKKCSKENLGKDGDKHVFKPIQSSSVNETLEKNNVWKNYNDKKLGNSNYLRKPTKNVFL